MQYALLYQGHKKKVTVFTVSMPWEKTIMQFDRRRTKKLDLFSSCVSIVPQAWYKRMSTEADDLKRLSFIYHWIIYLLSNLHSACFSVSLVNQTQDNWVSSFLWNIYYALNK